MMSAINISDIVFVTVSSDVTSNVLIKKGRHVYSFPGRIADGFIYASMVNH